VLKYRLQPTATDHGIFAAALKERFRAAAATAAEHRPAEVPDFMVTDAAKAMRLVRDRADALGVDAGRVGFLGFSAGAMIGLALAAAGPAARPAFLGAVYPSMVRRTVEPDAPPMFVAMAADDPLYGRQGFGLVEGWLAAGRSAELHVYGAGGHGFGMGRAGTTSTGLMDAFHAWLDCNGWLKGGRPA
jgi:acetyl esterase/lipase